MAGLDQIKHQARKEAWYGDSYNPFSKRRGTWGGTGNNAVNDPEKGQMNREVIKESTEPLSVIQTEPPYSRPFGSRSNGSNPDIRRSKDGEQDMATTMSGASTYGKQREGDSEETAVDRQPTRRESQEHKARRRFLGRFSKKTKDDENVEEDDGKKKRPWYKGKVLKHDPFTFRNQLERTLFNSWVNILLLAAPVGIAVNYAGINGKIVFVVNFVAIIPLAGMLSFATEEISLHVGESLGGLLNASFGYVILNFGSGSSDLN
jgi:Ca2+:H+ antiporter